MTRGRSARAWLQLIIYKARADLRAQVARSYLGVLWWIIEPVLYLGAFALVFTKIFQRGDGNYVPFLLIALVPWKWFASCLSVGCNSIMANGGLMKLVYLPKLVFPTITVVSATIKFAFIFVILIAFVLLWGLPITPAWLALPGVLILQFGLNLGVAMVAAALIPFAKDLRIVIDNLLLVLMFLSGVFYSPSDLKLSPEMQELFLLNPVADLFTAYRSILLEGTFPDGKIIAIIVAYTIVLMSMGYLLLKRYDRTFPKLV